MIDQRFGVDGVLVIGFGVGEESLASFVLSGEYKIDQYKHHQPTFSARFVVPAVSVYIHILSADLF